MSTTSTSANVIEIFHNECPKHYSYPTILIAFAVNLMNNLSIGYGSCRRILEVSYHLVNDTSQLPCRRTLGNWKAKFSHYSQNQMHADTSGRWAILYDISITIGKNKVLLIVGVNLDEYTFSQPLRFADCRVLYTGLSPSWPAERIAEQITAIKEKGYQLAYAVGDQGANIKRAAQDSQLCLVNDCSHWMANLMRRKYSQRADFQAFEKACTALKRKGTISSYAHILPPKHYAHSRFMNIAPVIKWAGRALSWLDHHRQEEYLKDCYHHLEWLLDYRELIEEMTQSIELIGLLCETFKDEGFGDQSYRWAHRRIQYAVDTDGVPLDLCRQVWHYVQGLEVQRRDQGHLICSTDVVESHFSYLKRKSLHTLDSEHHHLIVCQRTAELTEVKKAMESITLKILYEQRRASKHSLSVAEKRTYLNKLST